jgi:hypothetical protein
MLSGFTKLFVKHKRGGFSFLFKVTRTIFDFVTEMLNKLCLIKKSRLTQYILLSERTGTIQKKHLTSAGLGPVPVIRICLGEACAWDAAIRIGAETRVDEGQARSCLQRRNCAWQVENY